MTATFNVYCDESCHLENDHLNVMVLGAVWCPLEKARGIMDRLQGIKAEHGRGTSFEVKWSKVSPAGKRLYLDWLDYFFDDDDLHFRVLVVPDKSQRRHEAFGQDHDSWYFKMYFDMLKIILSPNAAYLIYLDVKDTRSSDKVRKLHEVLSNSNYDFSREIAQRVQTVRAHEVELLQLADLLIGAVSYANRGLSGNAGKEALVRLIQERSGYSLTRNTLLKEDKVNVSVLHAAAVPV